MRMCVCTQACTHVYLYLHECLLSYLVYPNNVFVYDSVHWPAADVSVDGRFAYPRAVHSGLWAVHLLAGAPYLHCPLQLDTTGGDRHRPQAQRVGHFGELFYCLVIIVRLNRGAGCLTCAVVLT